MRTHLTWILIFLGLVPFLLPSDLEKAVDHLTLREMQSVVEFLGHDLLEGRAPGTRGGQLAELYVQSLFKLMGLQPGFASGYLQPFALKGFKTTNISMEAAGTTYSYPDDLVGVYTRPQESFSLEADAIFVGYGIRTQIWKWDDFKNTDVRGKIIIARVNDPGMYRPDIFEGKVLTYFGRWRYKIEEAARAGAAGILLIHTDESAGYDWNVVKNSWGKENLYLESDQKNDLLFRGWIREDHVRKILESLGLRLKDLYAKSLKSNFKPVPLGIRFKISGQNSFRDTSANNVVACIPGQTEKQIVISAHIDHLGSNPKLSGDGIFNGAIDNGSAVTALMLTAKLFSRLSPPPYFTLVFLACQAEEEGLLGSSFFVENADRSKIVVNVNFESTPVWEVSRDVMGIGARYSTLDDLIREIAASQGWQYSEFSLAAQGFFYRSDQYPFAANNIPAVWLSAGEGFTSGKNRLAEFFVGGNYHTVKDEFDPTWTLEGLRQTVKLAVLLIERLNADRASPRWKGKLTFPTESTK